jgi:hypothetical protein
MENPSSVSWNTHEYEHRVRGKDWFWAVGITGVSLGIIAFLLHNTLFGVFIILATAIIIYLNLRHPREVTCTINEKEIKLHTDSIPLKKIKGFTFRGEHAKRKLILEIDRMMLPVQNIEINTNDEHQIETILLAKKIVRNDDIVEPFISLLTEKINL